MSLSREFRTVDGVDPWAILGAPEAPTGSITVEEPPDGPVMHLRGDIDADLFQRIGGAHLFDGVDIVAVDVGALRYIDSSGLTFLVRWAQARSRAGRSAVIRHTTPRFRQVLSIAGLSALFVCEE